MICRSSSSEQLWALSPERQSSTPTMLALSVTCGQETGTSRRLKRWWETLWPGGKIISPKKYAGLGPWTRLKCFTIFRLICLFCFSQRRMIFFQFTMTQGFCISCRRRFGGILAGGVFVFWVFKIVQNWCVMCHLCAEWYCWRDGNWENLQGQFQWQARPHCPCDASRKTGDFSVLFLFWWDSSRSTTIIYFLPKSSPSNPWFLPTNVMYNGHLPACRTQILKQDKSSSWCIPWRMRFWIFLRDRSRWSGWLTSRAGDLSNPPLSALPGRQLTSFKIITQSDFM